MVLPLGFGKHHISKLLLSSAILVPEIMFLMKGQASSGILTSLPSALIKLQYYLQYNLCSD